MAKEIVITKRFRENYRRLPKSVQNQFDNKLKYFLEYPQHPSLKIHRYRTCDKTMIWEGYVNRQYRFTFSVSNEKYTFRNIGPHSIIDNGKV